MTETRTSATVGQAGDGSACPGCGAPLSGSARGPVVTCDRCGRVLRVDALDELQRLTTWASWAQARAAWLRDRLAAGDLPAEGWSALGGEGVAGATPAPRPAGPPAPGPVRPRPTAGTLLLAGGAVLLVLAGIAFVAFAWDLLGPTGQLLTLYLLGALAVLAGVRLRTRLPGTATTLGIVGALLVAVSAVATRVLAVDQVGRATAVAVSVGAAVVLAAVGVLLRRRQRAVGEVAALVGAALALGITALAPADRTGPGAGGWAWWSAVTLLAGGVALLLLAHRLGVRTWPPLAAVALVVGSVVLAWYVSDRAPGGDATAAVVFCATTLALAVATATLVRVLPGHRPDPGGAAAALTAVAVVGAVATGLALPSGRPGSAAVLAAAALLVALAPRRLPAAVRRPAPVVAAGLLGGAVGLTVAPWADSWAWWRGPLAGAAVAALLVALAEARRHADDALPGLPALAAAVVALLLWVGAVTSGAAPTAEEVERGVAAALLVPALAAWAELVRHRLPAWSGWLAGAAASAAGVLLVAQAQPSGGATPELYALALASGAAVAGALCRWVRRPAHTPSLVTVGPALTLALAPSTWVVVQDAGNRWCCAQDPGAGYQVRVVALFVVGAVLVAVGVWRRLAGLVVPAAAALVVVTAVQLVELGRFLPQWVSFAVAGGVLVAAGARWESVRRLGREGGRWASRLR